MPRAVKIFLRLFASFLCFFASTLITPAQNSIEDFRKVLREKAAFGETDFAALGRGEPVVRLLPAADEKEVAVCGVVRVKNAGEVSLDDFRNSVTQKNNKSVLETERFGAPPALEDLQSLTLGKSDFEAMKKCAVGSCRLKMSAAMINRLQTDIDWSAPEHRAQATQLFRQMLFEYVRDYAARGNAALMQYDNAKTPLRLEAEHEYLLAQEFFLGEFAPEFAGYLKNYASAKLDGVDEGFRWSKVKFGLKPFVTITHTANYARREQGGKPQYWLATRQIYASRYVDSSLALAIFLSFPAGGAATETYVVFTNRSRSDALDGMFSELKRRIVEEEAAERVREILRQAKTRLENDALNQAESAAATEETGILPRTLIWLRNPLVQIFLLAFAAFAVFALLYRRRKHLTTGAAE